jgi:hypothetical protein
MSSLFLKFKFKFFQRYIANMIGAACNSRIPPATLQSVLNFVCVNNCSRMLLWKKNTEFYRQKEKDWLLLLHSYTFKNHLCSIVVSVY